MSRPRWIEVLAVVTLMLIACELGVLRYHLAPHGEPLPPTELPFQEPAPRPVKSVGPSAPVAVAPGAPEPPSSVVWTGAPGDDRSADVKYLGGAKETTRATVLARVAAFFKQHGITDADLIAMQALEESDRAYQEAIAEAARLRHDGQAKRAVEALEAALAGLDAKHLIGRAKLYWALDQAALEAGDLPASQRATQRLDATRQAVADLVARAAGKPAAAAALGDAARKGQDLQDRLYKLLDALGVGTDLSRLPARLDELGAIVAKGGAR